MKIRLILLIGLLSGVQAWAKHPYMADSTVQVEIMTNGTVSFTGGSTITGGLQGLVNKVQGADTIIKRSEQKSQNETIIFTKKDDKGKSHGSTSINVPKNFKLRFQTATGNVSLTDVEGQVKGRAESGNLNITRGKGKIELNTDAGDITVTQSEASGFVMTRRGNVTLQDVRGRLTGISQNGKVTYQTTNAYFTNRAATRFKLDFNEADIDIATAPEGGEFGLGKGNINVRTSPKSVIAKTQEGNITLGGVGDGVRAITKKGKVSIQLPSSAASGTQPIIIEAQDGDVDLLVPIAFAANFSITLIQTKDIGARYVINSYLDLGTIKAEEIIHPTSKTVVNRITQVNRSIRNGRRPVQIRVVNGNVNIKRL